jgi:NAD(P)-dependent dehydrogenase (short-subunit alcohol dehydrogenase family)
MTPDFAGAVAIVTGGARGIGRACALRLAGLGTRVAVVDRRLDGAAEYGETLGAGTVEEELHQLAGDGLGIEADLAAPDGAEAVAEQVTGRWGSLDVLVTVAGGAITPVERSAASRTTAADLATLFDANLATTVAACTAAVPAMRAGGGGAIVTIGSTAGRAVSKAGQRAGYGATKAAVHHYTRYLAAEAGPWGIRVNCVAPGVVRTARVVAQSVQTGLVSDGGAGAVPLRRLAEPSDIADVVQFLCGPLSSYVTGQLIGVDGGAVLA